MNYHSHAPCGVIETGAGVNAEYAILYHGINVEERKVADLLCYTCMGDDWRNIHVALSEKI